MRTLFKPHKQSKHGYAKHCKKCYNAALNKEKKFEAHVTKNYGITIEEYTDKMQTSSVCQCCKRVSTLCYDHDHTTMVFRGVLCKNCNAGIGLLGDSVEGVEKALNYLKEHYNGK
jgi:hypothetical protein